MDTSSEDILDIFTLLLFIGNPLISTSEALSIILYPDSMSP